MQHWWTWLCGAIGVAGVLLTGGILGAASPLDSGSQTTAGLAHARMRVAAYSDSLHVWPRWTRPATTIVPILSLGTPGLRLGLAQVSGPGALVGRVRAVLQVDISYQGVRGKVFVPSNSFTDLHRVQGTAVTGILQYQLLDFSAHHHARVAPQCRPQEHVVVQDDRPCVDKHHDHGHHYGWDKHHDERDRHDHGEGDRHDHGDNGN